MMNFTNRKCDCVVWVSYVFLWKRLKIKTELKNVDMQVTYIKEQAYEIHRTMKAFKAMNVISSKKFTKNINRLFPYQHYMSK